MISEDFGAKSGGLASRAEDGRVETVLRVAEGNATVVGKVKVSHF